MHDNLDHLGVDVLDVVNLRLPGFAEPVERSLAEPFEALVQMQEEGLIRHLGVSNVTTQMFAEAQSIGRVVCVQNHYNLVHRDDDPLIDALAREGIAYVPFFPLGGFTPLQSAALETVARRLETTPMEIALAWLLARSPNLLLIPGTSSVAHLEENLSRPRACSARSSSRSWTGSAAPASSTPTSELGSADGADPADREGAEHGEQRRRAANRTP